MKHNIVLFLMIALLSLSACQPMQPSMTRPQAPISLQTVPAETAGNYPEAAQQYLDLAAKNKGAAQAQYYLRAAKMWWQAGQADKTQAALDKIDRKLLTDDQQRDGIILEANVALAHNDADQTLSLVKKFDMQQASVEQQKAVLNLRINANQMNGNWLEKANACIALDPLLTDPTQRKQNQKVLWDALMQLTPKALELFNPGIPPAVDSGWFALAHIVKTYRANPDALQVAIEDWKRNYPNHPADPELYEHILTAGTRLPQKIKNIAILLHDAGPYAKAADAIKRGIIAAHFVTNPDTQLNFIDVKNDPQTGQSNVVDGYQQAVAMHADIVIGPLDKKSVETLANSGKLSIPVLALNRISMPTPPANLFQFGLAPEDDAISVANFAHAKGWKRTVILAPDNDWGNRIASTFSDTWRKMGGIILHQANYNEANSDFTSDIEPLFDLDQSKQRYSALKRVVGYSMEFDPRRRQDIDFVFVVANPLKARQLVSQLKFHRSGQLPILTTSHAYGGQPDPQQDIDLNGVYLTDIPWVFSDEASKDPVYQSLHQSSSDMGNLIQLYAMGADAYRLISHLNTMSRSPDEVFSGATGTLHINEQGQIQRDMPWATFKQGLISLLPENTNTNVNTDSE